MMHKSRQMRDLQNYGFAIIEGVKFKALPRELQTGDMYLAERIDDFFSASQPEKIELLTVAFHDLDKRIVVPKEKNKPLYDTEECIHVEFVED